MSTCSASARWASATRRSPPPSTPGSTAARRRTWVGRGTGVDDPGLARKIEAVEAAIALHRDHLSDPLELLRRLGGREIAALVGAILAARMQRVPVILDGYVVCAAAAILQALDPTALDHCLAGHVSAEQAHAKVLKKLGKAPLLDFGMRLGEGSGAALALGVAEGGVGLYPRHGDLRAGRRRYTRTALSLGRSACRAFFDELRS